MSVQVTQTEYDKLHEELMHVVNVLRPNLNKRADEARLMRDIPALKDCIIEQNALISKAKHLINTLETAEII